MFLALQKMLDARESCFWLLKNIWTRDNGVIDSWIISERKTFVFLTLKKYLDAKEACLLLWKIFICGRIVFLVLENFWTQDNRVIDSSKISERKITVFDSLNFLWT